MLTGHLVGLIKNLKKLNNKTPREVFYEMGSLNLVIQLSLVLVTGNVLSDDIKISPMPTDELKELRQKIKHIKKASRTEQIFEK